MRVSGCISAAVKNWFARLANPPSGSRSPRSNRASVLWSTPIRRAVSHCVSPRAVRVFTRRSAPVRPGGSGLQPRNRTIAGMYRVSG